MYRSFSRDEYEELDSQHNIMVLVGNGFDMSVLTSFEQPVTTSYESFYYFLRYRRCNKNNRIVKAIREQRDLANPNWSDFEALLPQLVKEVGDVTELESDLLEIQDYFSIFLNDIVTPQFLATMGKAIHSDNPAYHSMSKFLADLDDSDYASVKFPNETGHYDLFNFLFVNFNYTALLDNYLYLDREQYNPHRFTYADRNFQFWPNPENRKSDVGNADTSWSCYLNVDLLHPHGNQSVPRSIMFGYSEPSEVTLSSPDIQNSFAKTYWTQSVIRYRKYFDETRLFIVYGMSIGESDRWWWRNMMEAVAARNGGSEVIVYYYDSEHSPEKKQEIKDKLIGFYGGGNEIPQEIRKQLEENIYVVLFDDEKGTTFLNSGFAKATVVDTSTDSTSANR